MKQKLLTMASSPTPTNAGLFSFHPSPVRLMPTVRKHEISSLPHQQIEFEIPNECWVAAGMVGCRSIAVSYTATSDPCYPKTIVPISELEVTVRNKGAAWLQKERMVQIPKGFRTGDVLLPIEVDEPLTRTNLRYRVHDGFHRLFTSDK